MERIDVELTDERRAEERGRENALKKWFHAKGYRKKGFWGLIWILPGFALLLIFSYYPPIKAIIYSFTDWNGTFANWNNFENFVTLFTDTRFWDSFKNALILTLSGMILGNLFTIFLAELLHNCAFRKISAFFRFFFILPALVPGIVTNLLWARIIFSATPDGLINAFLMSLNLIEEPLTWYYGSETVLYSLVLTGFPWVAGTSFLIYLAGLQNIPESIVEAARLDGITTAKRLVYIDFPYLLGQIKYFLILGVIQGLQNYNLQFLITRGGPNNASMVPGYYIYYMAFNNGMFGYACSIGVFLFLILFVFTLYTNKKMRTTEDLQ